MHTSVCPLRVTQKKPFVTEFLFHIVKSSRSNHGQSCLVMTHWTYSSRNARLGHVPKILGSSLAEHREQVRSKLFAALSELMEANGFDAVSMADIASRAGVGRTSVYNHYPDKEAVLLAFIEHETEAYVRALRSSLEHVDRTEEQLRVYVREQINLKSVYHLAPGPDLRTVVSRETQMRLREHVHQ